MEEEGYSPYFIRRYPNITEEVEEDVK